jgi:hypothetical protein
MNAKREKEKIAYFILNINVISVNNIGMIFIIVFNLFFDIIANY